MTGDQTHQPNDGESSTGPHRMRIASSAGLKQYVTFALNFLQSNPSRPLILHTRPPAPNTPSPPTAPSKTKTSTAAAGPSTVKHSSSTHTLNPCTTNVPRLISVVEIIKRELLKRIAREGRGKGKHRAVGVWQYTETGLIDPSEFSTGEAKEGDDELSGTGDLTRVLGGKTRPKMTHHPYLEITLSTRPLGLEKDSARNITCQHVALPRRRARAPKEADPTGATEEAEAGLGEVVSRGDDMDVDLGAPIARPPTQGAGTVPRVNAEATNKTGGGVSGAGKGLKGGRERNKELPATMGRSGGEKKRRKEPDLSSASQERDKVAVKKRKKVRVVQGS